MIFIGIYMWLNTNDDRGVILEFIKSKELTDDECYKNLKVRKILLKTNFKFLIFLFLELYI